METVYIGVGSNLGDRKNNIDVAIKKLRNITDIEVVKTSTLIETDPEGGPPQGKYLNGAIEIQTSLTPYQLLHELKKIEKELGRINRIKNWPRPIDLDILTFGNKKINTPELVIPHPRMHERVFVQKPLKQLL